MSQPCSVCGKPADFALIEDDGTMHGWLCPMCDSRHRLKQMGWKRRTRRRLRRLFKL
jgi:DNA-directed RNA polymerase subunit RPC12/RpoP